MKLDLDLVREILLKAEETPSGSHLEVSDFNGRADDHTLSEHVEILHDEGYLDAVMLHDSQGAAVNFALCKLTLKGHDLLVNSRNKNIWEKVKQKAMDDGMSIPLSLLNSILEAAAKKYFGI